MASLGLRAQRWPWAGTSAFRRLTAWRLQLRPRTQRTAAVPPRRSSRKALSCRSPHAPSEPCGSFSDLGPSLLPTVPCSRCPTCFLSTRSPALWAALTLAQAPVFSRLSPGARRSGDALPLPAGRPLVPARREDLLSWHECELPLPRGGTPPSGLSLPTYFIGGIGVSSRKASGPQAGPLVSASTGSVTDLPYRCHPWNPGVAFTRNRPQVPNGFSPLRILGTWRPAAPVHSAGSASRGC